MVLTKTIINPDEKTKICNTILRALPRWFGVEASIVDYTNQVRHMPFFVVLSEGVPVGFVALKPHSSFATEIYVMGILGEYHRKGIGKQLIADCEQYCKENHIEFLTVKTLDETRESESYQSTRAFYLAMGFKPLEVFPLYWDADNPCLLMVKHIASG